MCQQRFSNMFVIILWVFLTSLTGALFKDLKFSNYTFKKSVITISNTLNTQLFVKKLTFKVLKEYS